MLLKVNHPLSIAYLLLGTAVLSGRMVFKVRISWLFYTLVLVFLGGVIVIIMYITSLAANEKIIYYNKLSYLGLLLFVGGLSSIWGLELARILKPASTFTIVGSLYEIAGGGVVILAAGALLVCIFSVIKLIKFETGPLVKRV